ncbi:hypothetical protein AB4Z01_14790 [Inquilinus sp. YAF38]|uniref:hypothetical protein n=1 Tax=Inquilinus sp. YAF38 TaxID=3233084 RepID=UPI003F92735A
MARLLEARRPAGKPDGAVAATWPVEAPVAVAMNRIGLVNAHQGGITSGMGTTSDLPPEDADDPARKDRDRRTLREALLLGAKSPLTSPVDAAYFESLRDRIRRAAERRNQE